jgi:hypothetical protein
MKTGMKASRRESLGQGNSKFDQLGAKERSIADPENIQSVIADMAERARLAFS